VPDWARRLADGLLLATAIGIPLSTTGMQAAVLGLTALTVVATVSGWGIVRPTPLDGVLVIFYATLALSTVASGHPLEAVGWQRLWVVTAYLVVFWWLRDAEQAARVTRLLLGVAAFTAAYGILQHYTGADWYRTALGRLTRVHAHEADAGYAVVGFFGNYLTFAHAMLFPLAWAMADALRGGLLGLAAGPVIVVALAFSTARGAWLATVPMAAALVLMTRGRRAVWSLVALAALGGLIIVASPALRARAAGSFATTGLNAGRIGIWRANLDIVREHPVFGLGFGRYRAAALPYYERHPDADRRSHAHSNYLQLAAEAGLLGLAAFALVFATALLRGWTAVVRAGDDRTWVAAAGAWAGMVGFLVGGVTQYTFGDSEVALTMWVVLGILMRLRDP
jgi:O-antigen ligase